MKRVALILLFACLFCSINVFAGNSYNNDGSINVRNLDANGISLLYNSDGSIKEWGSLQLPVFSSYTLSGITIYVVTETTGTSASYKQFPSSASITTTGGLYPGTTYFDLTISDKDTVGEYVDFLNAIAVGTIGAGGGIVATVPQGCYDGNISTGLAVNHTGVNVMSSTNTKTISFDTPNAIYGMSYIISAPTNGDMIYLGDVCANATFGSGTAKVTIYDGDSTTDTIIREEHIATTVVDAPMDFKDGWFRNSANTAMRIDIIGSSAGLVTAAKLNFTWSLKQ